MRQRGSRHKPGKLWFRGALLLLASALLLAPQSAFAKEGKKLTKRETTLKRTKHRARARSAAEGTTEALGGGSEPFGPELPSQPWQLEAPATLNGNGLGILNATFVASASDAWAVGSGNAEGYTALAEQWNGSRWTAVPTTDLGAPDEVTTPLYGVGGTGPDDVWAVGGNSGAPTGGLIEHWNGTSWSIAPPVGGEPATSTLLAVSADSPSDAWAVGESSVNDAHNSWKQPLLEHFNGSEWKLAEGVFAGEEEDHKLIAVDAISPSDVWALGNAKPRAEYSGNGETVLEHFDGSEWSFVPTPEVEGGALRAISAVSPDDIWAVGAPGYEAPQLIEHWNGSEWSVVPTEGLPAANLSGVVALSANDVWAAGRAFTEHWNGRTWTVVPNAAEHTRVEHPSGLAGGPLFDVGANEDGGEGVIIEQPAP